MQRRRGIYHHLLAAFVVCITVLGTSTIARAHFSYSDPRIVHLAEQEDGRAVMLIRMPAPLALLPDDWQGSEETRVAPYGLRRGDGTVLDLDAVENGDAALRERLGESARLWAGGMLVETCVEEFRFWSDDARPRFGTLKSALAAFDAPVDRSNIENLSYFDLTLDVLITAPLTSLSAELRLESGLGHRFRVMDRLGTVVKLHRNDATETGAAMGALDVSFPKIVERWEIMLRAALFGAEHIYLGLDHLAMIILIAIAAPGWRAALAWATAFTVGHMITLIAGLYGVAPAAAWFVPMVEVAIALSIVVTGVVIFLRRDSVAFGWIGLLIIGLIHGYGFAASASEALFAGEIDPMNLAAFAIGLELCQFAVYALILPLILLLDRASTPISVNWRRAVALVIALSASSTAVLRLSEASNAFSIV